MGKPDAPVKVIEYLSNTCSHCARFDAEVFPTIKKQYIDTGKVSWAVREYLTPPEQLAAAGFVLARCAGRDKYWGVIEALFHSQEALFKGTDPKTIYGGIARSAGLSDAQFQACMADDSLYKGVADRMQKAITEAPDGTPTFYVNGKRLNSGDKLAGRPFNGGEMPLDQFQAAYAAAGGK
jgi:protein-disulfide isomerase